MASLRPLKSGRGVKFHNIPPANGREMTAEDVKYTFERIKDPKTRSPQAANLAEMVGFQAPDSYTFVIKYSRAKPSLVQGLSATALAIFPREVIEQYGIVNKHWIGTGPFILKEYMPNSRAIYEKNPDYWGKGLPYLDRAEYIVIPEEA